MYKYINKIEALYTANIYQCMPVNKLKCLLLLLYKEIIRYKYIFWRRQVDIDVFLFLFLYKMK